MHDLKVGAASRGSISSAKGTTILLVVLLHAQTVLVGGGWTGPGGPTAMDALSTLRMPTFFLISGFVRPGSR